MKENESLLKLLIIIFLFFFLLFGVSLLNPSLARANTLPITVSPFLLSDDSPLESPAWCDTNSIGEYPHPSCVPAPYRILLPSYCYRNYYYPDLCGYTLFRCSDFYGTYTLFGNNYTSIPPISIYYSTNDGVRITPLSSYCKPYYYYHLSNNIWTTAPIPSSRNYARPIDAPISTSIYSDQVFRGICNSQANCDGLENTYDFPANITSGDTFQLTDGSTSFGITAGGSSGGPLSGNRYYIEYKNNYASTGHNRAEFNGTPFISENYAVGANLIAFTSDFNLFYIDGAESTLLDDTYSDYPPYLQITDIDNPCANILRSNISLEDDAGNVICKATVNPMVEQLVQPFDGVINFNPALYDWGAFDILKTPAKIFFDAIDGTLLWFYGLWTKLLDIFIPPPDVFAFFAQDISNAFETHFPTELISNITDVFDDMENMTDDEIPVIQGSLMGVTVNFVDFSLIDSSMFIIRPILTGMLIFIIVITYIKLFQLYFAKN